MSTTSETLELLKSAQQSPDDALAKSVTQNNAVVAYNLEGPALKMYPVLTPNRNRIARTKNGAGKAVEWRVYTGINVNNTGAGVSEGNRGARVDSSWVPKTAGYRAIGLENDVTYEAEYATKSYEDAKAVATEQLLQATMIAEERILTSGNASLALGTAPTPVLALSGTGGTIPAGTAASVIVVALTTAGWRRASLVLGVPGLITKTNADGSVDTFGGGASAPSAAAVTAATSGATSSVLASVTPVRGAVAYAWFIGVAGSERLAAITTVSTATLTALPSAPAQLASTLSAVDVSTDSLIFDGLLTYAMNPAYGGYFKAVNGPLTSDGAAGVNEITDMFQFFWDNYKASPDELQMSAQQALAINKMVIQNGGAPLIRFTAGANEQHGKITAGVMVGSILNPITGTVVDIVVHPDFAPGVIMAQKWTSPYPLSGVTTIVEMEMRQEYYQLEWPPRARRHEYGVYADGVLKHYAPFLCGVLVCIAKS